MSGDPDTGFQITVTLEYNRDDQGYTCNASHRFSHQIQVIGTKNPPPLIPPHEKLMTGLRNRAGHDFLAAPGLLMTSCDTHLSGYDDITATLDFNKIGEGSQVGTVILCQMNSYCTSYDEENYNSCKPVLGGWQRCHQVNPKSGSDQIWTYSSKLTSSQVLEMEFAGMQTDRRYELNVGEFSMAGNKLRETRASRFYIDTIRPNVLSRITNDEVGAPDDGRGSRNYSGPFTNWKVPNGASSGWLQCNQKKVTFEGELDDQFIHNLKDCQIEGSRQDGTGGHTTHPTAVPPCDGELNGIQQGRQTITFKGADTCGAGQDNELVWDTDLPSSFEAQDFANPTWLYHTQKKTFPIETIVPAKDLAGKFPKHYSVDCTHNFMGDRPREDGDSGELKCLLEQFNPTHDDGCNPAIMIAQYYHVCGGSGVCKDTKWGVYVPLKSQCTGPSCKCDLVQCEPGLGCCDLSKGTCPGVGHHECGHPQTRDCTDPVGGTQGPGDEVASDCPPLGLNHCSYHLPCEAQPPYDDKNLYSEPAQDACLGLREGDQCGHVMVPYACDEPRVPLPPEPTDLPKTRPSGWSWHVAVGTGWTWQYTPPPITKSMGTCQQVALIDPPNEGSCTPRIIRRCEPPGVIQYRNVQTNCSGTASGICTGGICSAGGPCGGADGDPCIETGDCRPNCCTSWVNSSPSPAGACSLNGSSCTVFSQERCTTRWQYKLETTPCPSQPIPTGVCKEPSGGCGGYPGGGGGDQCDVRKSSCTAGGIVTCNSTVECCSGDVWPGNPNCVSDCVKMAGKGCCVPSKGGDCTGQFCSTSGARDLGDGVCRPTCAALAAAQGFDGDGTSKTSAWTYSKTHSKSSCTELGTMWLWGSNDWAMIPIIDNKEPIEVAENGGQCCGRIPLECDSSEKCCDTDTYFTNPQHCPLNGECNSTGCEHGKPDPDPPPTSGTWRCKGLNEGSDSQSCGSSCDSTTQCCSSDTYSTNPTHCPLDGVCGSTGCAQGNPNPSSPNLNGIWQCEGINGGADANCIGPINAINGDCSSHGCFTGKKENHNDGRWTCLGENGGSPDGPCGTVISSTDGDCDESQDNGCTAGQWNDVDDTRSYYKWQCLGINGGRDDNCSKQKPSSSKTDGQCCNPLSDNCCAEGRSSDLTDSLTHYKWECLGLNGGSKVNCSMPIPPPPTSPTSPPGTDTNGDCDESQKDKCTAGTWNNVADSTNYYKWKCVGSGNGTTDYCSMQRPSTCSPDTNGDCDESQDNGCHAGTSNDTRDSSTHYKWQCLGSCSGTTDNCSMQKPTTPTQQPPQSKTHGQCGNYHGTKCSAGTYSSRNSSDPEIIKWACEGSNGGRDDPCEHDKCTCSSCTTCPTCNRNTTCCSGDKHPSCTGGTNSNCTPCPQTECGACGSSANTCNAGEQHNHPADTDTHILWTCRNIPNKYDSGCNQRKIECSEAKPTPPTVTCGSCGSSANTCSSGTQHNHPADTGTHILWTCLNEPNKYDSRCGYRKVECSEAKPTQLVYDTCGNECGECENQNGHIKSRSWSCVDEDGNSIGSGACVLGDSCYWQCDNNNGCDAVCNNCAVP